MSPRSKEFYDQARRRLEGGKKNLEAERAAELREAADYDALAVEEGQTRAVVASAERFLAALDERIH